MRCLQAKEGIVSEANAYKADLSKRTPGPRALQDLQKQLSEEDPLSTLRCDMRDPLPHCHLRIS